MVQNNGTNQTSNSTGNEVQVTRDKCISTTDGSSFSTGCVPDKDDDHVSGEAKKECRENTGAVITLN
jgi:hypothetical protein